MARVTRRPTRADLPADAAAKMLKAGGRAYVKRSEAEKARMSRLQREDRFRSIRDRFVKVDLQIVKHPDNKALQRRAEALLAEMLAAMRDCVAPPV